MQSVIRCPVAGFIAGLLATAPLGAQAGITLYDQESRYLEIGGRLQVQYFNVDPDTGGVASTDDLFFRRLRLYVEGSLTETVSGKWQVDFGSDGEDAETKDAYIRYSGLGFGEITVGNQKVPFSREQLTSSKRQQLVERTFAGDHDFGVPDRQIGISVSGGNDTLRYAVGGYQAGIDGSTGKVDFESRASQPNDDDNFYVGNLLGGRLDWSPMGSLKYEQGAFGADTSLSLGVNGYIWRNDDDEPDPDGDGIGDEYDDISGVGVDAAFRHGYLSVDAAYQVFRAESIDPVTEGLLVDGNADFETYLLKGGYMIVPSKLEGVVSYSVLDAEAYRDRDQRLAFGLNWFLNRHNDKIQFTYELGSDVIDPQGETAIGDDQNVLFLQFQHVL